MEVINLNLIPNGTNPVVHVSQYDEGREFRFNLFDGNSVVTLDGTETIECDVKKPDGNIVTVAVTNTSSDYIVIATTLQMTACGGESLGTINITKGGVNLYSKNFVLFCERSPLENGIESESSIHNLATQVAEDVAIEVANQYDSANVLFDNTPTSGHNTPYTVTSASIKTALDTKQDNITTKTASGDLITISDGGDNIPLKSCEVTIEPIQASGTPTPSNPLPITTYTEMNVTRCCKNLVLGSIPNTTINESGKITYNTSFSMWYAYIKDGCTYSISNNNTAVVGGYYSSVPTMGSTSVDGTRFTTLPNTFTSSYTGYICFRTSSSYAYAQVEVGSSQTTYEAPNTQNYNISFGQTVYGGSGDVISGDYESTHDRVDLSTLSWTRTTSYTNPIFYANISDKKISSTNSLCEVFKNGGLITDPTALNNMEDNSFGAGQGDNTIYIRCDSCSDIPSFETLVSGKHIVYELATPTSLSLTPINPKTISGVNNIYNDCGQTDIEYFPNSVDGLVTLINDFTVKNATELPISDSDTTNTKDYIDNLNLNDLTDTDISGETSGQILAYDGDNWVNTNQIVVKYEEKDIAFDSSGEGTLYFANGYILGLKDIPSDSLYIGYITYMAGTKTMVKGFNRSATSFDSASIANTTRKIGIYYLDYITTQ